MAENASTVFNVHVPEFVDAIWVALRDPTLAVREKAVESLHACLRVIEKRETRWRVQWYYRMFEATQDGLGRNAPVPSIHGSLLAVAELLRNTGEFMMSRYREVAEIVLKDTLYCCYAPQLFGLVNNLLENSRKTAEKDLSIQRYDVIPLSPNSGLIEWIPNCDTLHHLIREYRDARKITLNQEHKLMLSFAPDYDNLPLIAKVEVFEYALQNTEGNDLSRVLWLKSRTSEVWLDRRTNYTRSLAVMSMVGYRLGLGDRRPSNLMLHRYSGKILQIDFGDCFEASMNRKKFPEKVPFRLTRMLVKAMEVSGLEGNFRSTCENVMQVLRLHKDSVMAMMEAFVHDPLINWRLFNFNEVPQVSTLASAHVPPVVNSEESSSNRELLQPQRGARERELLQVVNQLGDANEVLNERAVAVMARMSNKLSGRDFSATSASSSSLQHALDHSTLISGETREADHGLSVKLQVQKLIQQAMSHENLCQKLCWVVSILVGYG